MEKKKKKSAVDLVKMEDVDKAMSMLPSMGKIRSVVQAARKARLPNMMKVFKGKADDIMPGAKAVRDIKTNEAMKVLGTKKAPSGSDKALKAVAEGKVDIKKLDKAGLKAYEKAKKILEKK